MPKNFNEFVSASWVRQLVSIADMQFFNKSNNLEGIGEFWSIIVDLVENNLLDSEGFAVYVSHFIPFLSMQVC